MAKNKNTKSSKKSGSNKSAGTTDGYKDLVYQLQIQNEAAFDTNDALERINNTLTLGNVQLASFLGSETKNTNSGKQKLDPTNVDLLPKGEDIGNKEVVAGLTYLSNIAESSLFCLKRIDFASDQMMQSFMSMVDFMKTNGLQSLESNKELADAIARLEAENKELRKVLKEKGKVNDTNKEKDKIKMGWKEWALAIGAALSGFITGFALEIVRITKILFVSLSKELNFSSILKKVSGSKFVKSIKKSFDGIVQTGERLASKTKALYRIIKKTEFVESIKKSFDGITRIGERLASKTKALYRIIQKTEFGVYVSKVIKGLDNARLGIVKAFDDVAEFVGRFGSKIRALYQIIKRSEFGVYITEVIKGLDNARLGIVKAFDDIAEFVGRFRSKINALYQMIKRSELGVYVTQLFDGFMNIGKGISEAFAPVLKSFRLLKRTLSWNTEASVIIQKLTGAVESVGTWFMRMRFVTKAMFKLGKALGPFAGKLLIPLQVILSIWDSVTGFIEGFSKTKGNIIDKLLGGLRDGVKKFLDGLIGGVFDIMKSLVSWAAGALGFKELEKALDSFKFGDIIDNIGIGLGYVMKFAGNIMTSLGEATGIFSKIAKAFGGIIGKLAWPITAILGIFDFITGFIKDFNSTESGFFTKLVSGLRGGFSKLVDGLLGGLLDMIKNVGSWMLKMLGFDEVSKSLDKFKFTGFFKRLFGGKDDNKADIELKDAKLKEKEKAREEQQRTSAYPKLSSVEGMLFGGDLMDRFANDLYNGNSDQLNAATLQTLEKSNVGAEMNALESDTAKANAEREAAPVILSSPESSSGNRNVINNSQSVTYNSNNMPDRTDWMLRTALFSGF
jgi:hypothetical protein